MKNTEERVNDLGIWFMYLLGLLTGLIIAS